MLIDISNATILGTRETSIHDDHFIDFNYCETTRCIRVNMLSKDSKESYIIEFESVIGFKMTTCSFWGPTSRVYWFGCLKTSEYTIIPDLMKITQENTHFHNPFEDKEYIEAELIMCSGDSLTIACKRIKFNK